MKNGGHYIYMTRDRLMVPTFFTILNEIWTDFVQFSNAGGGLNSEIPRWRHHRHVGCVVQAAK